VAEVGMRDIIGCGEGVDEGFECIWAVCVMLTVVLDITLCSLLTCDNLQNNWLPPFSGNRDSSCSESRPKYQNTRP